MMVDFILAFATGTPSGNHIADMAALWCLLFWPLISAAFVFGAAKALPTIKGDE